MSEPAPSLVVTCSLCGFTFGPFMSIPPDGKPLCSSCYPGELAAEHGIRCFAAMMAEFFNSPVSADETTGQMAERFARAGRAAVVGLPRTLR